MGRGRPPPQTQGAGDQCRLRADNRHRARWVRGNKPFDLTNSSVCQFLWADLL
jgi:hypothetical protein